MNESTAQPTTPTATTSQPKGFLAHTSRAVYGTIVATAVLAAEASTLEDWGPWHFFATLVVTLVVLWFSEIYSDVLGDGRDIRLSTAIRDAADEHWAVLEAGVPLGIPLLLGGVGVLSENAAVWSMLIVAVLALGIWGGLSARNKGRGAGTVALAAATSAGIGILIIILKNLH